MAEEADAKQVWRSLSAAIGAEMREARTIRGLSGQDHPVQGIAVDDKTKRVVIFSAEPSPRIAALMQTDVQATLPDAHVLVARPVIFDLSEIARRVLSSDGVSLIELFKQMSSNRKRRAQKGGEELFGQKFAPVIKPLFETASKVQLPFAVQVMDIVEQLANLNWAPALNNDPAPAKMLSVLMSVGTLDSAEADRRLGICPIPLYDFSDVDYEQLLSGKDTDGIRERLKALGILQYFYPPPDQLILGLADKQITKNGSLVGAAEEAPMHGHPLGEAEILSNTADLIRTLEDLKDIGYVAQGEFGIEITEKGRTVRQTINIRPSEGLISKISKILSVKVGLSVKDLFK